MKRALTCLLILSLAGTIFANGLSLNSPGPRALAMGGAFVGLANDGSAIYWNPAGLAGQESAIKLIATDIIPLANYQLAAYGIDTEAEMIHYLGPNIFFNYLMGDLALGLGIFVPAGIGTEWDGADLLAFAGPPQIDLLGDGSLMVTNPYAGKEFEWMSKIAVIDISPALAYQISDKVSLGVAANIYYGMLELKRG
ncbi:MAG: outer membrane protein transport protein, partial [Candidatus Cloacimonetes bacterium]|nr:outer membrane protein transport protein [Candidatus Cloacimonadota bacterium]